MKTVILPGFSERNKDWADEMAGKINLGHEVVVHNWRHWSSTGSGSSSQSFSLKYEIDEIKKKIGSGKFNIIAKSVGSRVALRLMHQVKPRLNKVILTGIASTGDAMKKVMQKSLPDFPIKRLLVIQNTNDPYSNYHDVEKLIHSINSKVKILEKPGSEHNYPYPEEFEKFLQ